MPVRISSGWWSKVITVGSGAAVPRRAPELAEQVLVAAVQAVEHADDDEQPAERSLEGVDARHDRHREARAPATTRARR